ncbi:hypothetical protein VPH35_078056 [Triticum aestivum]
MSKIQPTPEAHPTIVPPPSPRCTDRCATAPPPSARMEGREVLLLVYAKFREVAANGAGATVKIKLSFSLCMSFFTSICAYVLIGGWRVCVQGTISIRRQVY